MKYRLNNIKGIVLTLIILGAVVALFMTAVSGASEQADAAAMANLERAVRRAAVQAYAIEGFFPPSLDELVERYGLIIDGRRFIVYYRALAPNLMPVIQVRRFGVADEG